MALKPIIAGRFYQSSSGGGGGGGGLTVENITATGDRDITSADVGKLLVVNTSGVALNLKLRGLVTTPGFLPGDRVEVLDVYNGYPTVTIVGDGINVFDNQLGIGGPPSSFLLTQGTKYTLTFLGDPGSGDAWQIDYAPAQLQYAISNSPSQALTTTLTPDTSQTIGLTENSGRWLVTGHAHIKFNGATFAAPRIVTVALWNAVGGFDLMSFVAYTPVITTQSHSMGVYPINYVVDTTGLTGGVSLCVAVSILNLPSAGTITLEGWGLQATKLQ